MLKRAESQARPHLILTLDTAAHVVPSSERLLPLSVYICLYVCTSVRLYTGNVSVDYCFCVDLHRRIRGDLQPIVQSEAQVIFVFKMLAPFIHRLSLEGPQVIAEVGEGCSHGYTYVHTVQYSVYVYEARASHIKPRGVFSRGVLYMYTCVSTPLTHYVLLT